MPTRADILATVAQPQDPSQVRRFSNDVADLIHRPIAGVRLTAAAQVGNTRAFTGQVIDRRGRSMSGRWVVLLTLAAADNGDPSATANALSITTGVAIHAFVSNASVLVLTNTAGVLGFDLTLGGSGARERWVAATAMYEVTDAEFEWA